MAGKMFVRVRNMFSGGLLYARHMSVSRMDDLPGSAKCALSNFGEILTSEAEFSGKTIILSEKVT